MPYPAGNVDTDEIVPARFLYRDRKDGFADTLFHDLRLDAAGGPRPEFALNLPRYANPKVLVGGPNFGCGSSREHAVWALLDHGIECVIAPSFGDIFRNNALQNGLLTIVLAEAAVAELVAGLQHHEAPTMTVDLPGQQIVGADGTSYAFAIDPYVKQSLIKGLSKIDETLLLRSAIDDFEKAYRSRYPWAASTR